MSFIINNGKRIKVESYTRHTFIRDADSPGLTTVLHRDGNFNLPGNKVDAINFIKAYLYCVEANVEYRKKEFEDLGIQSFLENANGNN